MKMFTVGDNVTVDGHDVVALPGETPLHSDHVLLWLRNYDEFAWATLLTDGRDHRKRATVTALACAYCNVTSQTRCCTFAFCDTHHREHQAVEHANVADGARYEAALSLSGAVVNHRASPDLPRIPHTPYPRDMTLRDLDARNGDGLRVLEHIRTAVAIPDGVDPIGDLIQDAAERGLRFPSPAQARWLATDVLARCTWPVLAETAGDHETASWLRNHRPAAKSQSELAQRLYNLDFALSDFARDQLRTPAGEIAAADALCELWRGLPLRAPDALGYSGGLGAEVFSRALTLENGPLQVGRAVARAQSDAVARVLEVLGAQRP